MHKKDFNLSGSQFCVTTTTGGGAREGTSQAIEIILYGNKGHSKPHILGDAEDFRFNMGNTDSFNVSSSL